MQAPGPQRLRSGFRFISPHAVRVVPSFYLLMSRGACWAATQLHLADGVNLGIWEGPGTRQMAPGRLGFCGGILGSSLDLVASFFFF